MSQSKPATPPESADFETALKELERLVEQLEGGQLSLSESLDRFERGIALSRSCHDLLEQARLTVTRLSNDSGSEPAGDEAPESQSKA